MLAYGEEKHTVSDLFEELRQNQVGKYFYVYVTWAEIDR